MGQVKSMIESRPRLDLYTGWIPNSDFMPIRRHYPESSLVNAWHKLMLATVPDGADGFMPPSAAVFDVVDVTRQVLSDAFARLFVNLAGFVHVKTRQGDALPTGTIKTVSQAEERMQLLLDMMTDMDAMLATQGHMLLGKVTRLATCLIVVQGSGLSRPERGTRVEGLLSAGAGAQIAPFLVNGFS